MAKSTPTAAPARPMFATELPVVNLPSGANSEYITSLMGRHQQATSLTNRGFNANTFRKALLARIKELKKERKDAAIAKAEEALQLRPELLSFLAAADFFRNAAAGTTLNVINTTAPAGGVGDMIASLKDTSTFQTIAVLEDVDADQAKSLAEAVAAHARRGTMAQVLFPIPHESYEAMIARYQGPDGLLGSDDCMDHLMALRDRVYDPVEDPHAVTAHSLVGAFLGKRLKIDSQVHLGEPVAGDRGRIGVLKCGKLLGAIVNDELRFKLVQFGINVARKWTSLREEVVMDSNRSLLAGDQSRYVFSTTARLKMWILSAFHATAEHWIYMSGRRSKGGVDKATGLMNALLQELIGEGWLEKGTVSPDYRLLKLRLNVVIKPVLPVDSVEIVYGEH